MQITISKIVSVTQKTAAAGHTYSITVFSMPDGRQAYTLAKVEEGQSYEGDLAPDRFGKLKFTKAKFTSEQKPLPIGATPKETPSSMNASYSKDIVIALIAAGKLTEEVQIDKALQHYYNTFKNIEDGALKEQVAEVFDTEE